jgi:hypothetical protein
MARLVRESKVTDELLEANETEDLDEIDGLADEDETQDEPTVDTSNRKTIYCLPQNFSIRELLIMRAEKDLNLRPGFQRSFVFDKQKASRLVESILLDVPIPVLYFSEDRNGKYSVVDGQQRITSFLSFVDGKFPVGDSGDNFVDFTLSGLKVLHHLNRKTFSDLDVDLQKKIKSATLNVIIIKKESDENVKFDIFERLNTGAMKLNEDEIRNSVYRGPYIDLLEELADDPVFGSLVRKPNYKLRMWYRGMVLRFFALSEKTYLNYKPSMKQFCNKELTERQFMQPAKIKEYQIRFKKSVELCRSVFGENSFRRFKQGDSEKNRDGNWSTTRINMALFDIQMCGFVNYTNNQIINHADDIREALIDLMCNDTEFIQSIETQTSGAKQMVFRFEKWLGVLKQIVDSQTYPRIFPYAVKRQLFESDPTCKICGNQIMMIEDAEVDHKDPYSKGGPTIFDNAQIAHRYCNRHKSSKLL